MTDFTKAAKVVADFTALAVVREKLADDIREWTEANPYKVYGDYRDEFDAETVTLLLEDRQAFEEKFCEIEDNAFIYAEWAEHRADLINTFADRIAEAYPELFTDRDADDAVEWEELPDELTEAFEEAKFCDCSDLLETMLRNTQLHIVAIPYDPDAPEGISDPDDAGIGPPNGDLDEEQNAARVAYLAEKFGIDGWAAESCYYHESLKVMGRLDLRKVYEEGKPTAITIGPDSSLIFHTSWNGSGCMGDVRATKTVTLPARFIVDSGSYGIDAVYGFTGEVWSGDLAVAEWEPWQ